MNNRYFEEEIDRSEWIDNDIGVDKYDYDDEDSYLDAVEEATSKWRNLTRYRADFQDLDSYNFDDVDDDFRFD